MNSNTPAQKNQLEITPVSDFLKNRGSLTSIPVNSIIADPIFQMRENGTDNVIVRRYAEVMQQNDPDGWQLFPRITVLSVSDASDARYCPEDYENVTHKYTRVYVVGGFHRLAAIIEQGYEHVEAVVIHGSTADGIVFAAGENDDKSVRRTLKCLRNAVLSCLKHSEIKAWSNPKIAEICGVDVQTVRNWELWLYKNDPDYSRPDKLKFRDKYGGVGLRKHSIPNFAVEDEKAEAEEKQRETNYKAFVGHRDAAHHAWKRFCEKKEIPFDWDAFCLEAEKHLDGEGCLSLPNPNTSTLDEIREKSLTCQKLKTQITGNAGWVTVYCTDLEFAEKGKEQAELEAKESKQDLDGLRDNLSRMQGSDTEPIPSILSKLYHVPEDVVRSEIKRYDDDLAKEAAAEDGPDLQGLREAIDDLLDHITHDIAIEVPGLAGIYGVAPDAVEEEIARAKANRGIAPDDGPIQADKLEDNRSWLGPEDESTLNKLYKSLTSNDLLQRYRDFCSRNTGDIHRLAGYRLLRGSAYGRKLFDEIDKIDASTGHSDEEKANDEQKRAWTMEEVEELYDSIEGEIGDLSEEEQIQVRQFLKVNYDAYPTYQWRDKLKAEALETLAETLDQICRGIGEKGLEAFKLSPRNPDVSGPSDSSEPPPPTEPLQVQPLGTADSAPPDERPSINFKSLGWGTKGNIRNLARSSKSLLEEEDLTEDFKAILSNLLDTILDFADSDELLKKILEASE